MLDSCVQCGQYRPDKAIEPNGPFAICPECGWPNPFRQLPLFIVPGAMPASRTICSGRLAVTLSANAWAK